MDLIEKVARELCEASDPDQVGGSFDGGTLPRDKPAWTAWIDQAEAVIKIVRDDL